VGGLVIGYWWIGYWWISYWLIGYWLFVTGGLVIGLLVTGGPDSNREVTRLMNFFFVKAIPQRHTKNAQSFTKCLVVLKKTLGFKSLNIVYVLVNLCVSLVKLCGIIESQFAN